VVIAPTFGGTVTINPAGVGAINNMVIGNTVAQRGNFTTVDATGNVTSSTYFVGDGRYLVNLPNTQYSNANVIAFLPTYGGNIAAGNVSVTGNINVTGVVNGTLNGQLNGIVNNVNPVYGVWDFGYITPNTYSNPTQWIFALTGAGNIDMGTITAPGSLNIDIGTIF
jgi:hypothetical protein